LKSDSQGSCPDDKGNPFSLPISFERDNLNGLNMKEIWKDIPGYEGKYQVSNYGRVKSLARLRLLRKDKDWTRPVNERILKPQNRKRGYQWVNLSSNNIMKCFAIHGLVWMCFGNAFYDKNKFVLDHIDNSFGNNKIDNLQLLTSSQNIGKGWFQKGKKLPTGITIKNGRYVVRYQYKYKTYYCGSYLSIQEAIYILHKRRIEIIKSLHSNKEDSDIIIANIEDNATNYCAKYFGVYVPSPEEQVKINFDK
jgi:hypothetical protein